MPSQGYLAVTRLAVEIPTAVHIDKHDYLS